MRLVTFMFIKKAKIKFFASLGFATSISVNAAVLAMINDTGLVAVGSNRFGIVRAWNYFCSAVFFAFKTCYFGFDTLL